MDWFPDMGKWAPGWGINKVELDREGSDAGSYDRRPRHCVHSCRPSLEPEKGQVINKYPMNSCCWITLSDRAAFSIKESPPTKYASSLRNRSPSKATHIPYGSIPSSRLKSNSESTPEMPNWNNPLPLLGGPNKAVKRRYPPPYESCICTWKACLCNRIEINPSCWWLQQVPTAYLIFIYQEIWPINKEQLKACLKHRTEKMTLQN